MDTETEPRVYFPEPAQPLPGAVLNDWRFCQYVLTMQLKEKKKFLPPYITMEIKDTVKPKGKKSYYADDVMFCFAVITQEPATLEEQENL